MGHIALPGELRYFARKLSPEFSELEIVPTGDVHYGNPMSSQKHFERHVKSISERPNRYTVLMGDLCESALKDTKGDIYHQTYTPQEQRDYFIRMLTPIKDKILGMVTGNHEARIADRCGVDISRDIGMSLGVPYRAEGIILKVSFGSQTGEGKDRPYTYFLYATHGYGGARTAAAKSVKVERTSTYVSGCSVYMMGHDHVVNVAARVELEPDNRSFVDSSGFETGKVRSRKMHLVKTNSFLKWAGYAEMGGFAPSDLDAPIIKLAGTGLPRVRVES